jgi:hypothetical protein
MLLPTYHNPIKPQQLRCSPALPLGFDSAPDFADGFSFAFGSAVTNRL